MNVILLERIEKLGQLGETVRVKDGFARNYLLPMGKALRATKANQEKFEAQRSEIEARNAERREAAMTDSEKLDGESFVMLRQAGESGQLYGSVSTRDIAKAASESGIAVKRNQVQLESPIKTIGLYQVKVALHAEVAIEITINVARSQDEAEAQARGEILTGPASEREDALAAAEELLAESQEDESADEVATADADDADAGDANAGDADTETGSEDTAGEEETSES